MAIELSKEARQRAVASIKAYFVEQLDDEIGDLKAGMLLDYFLEEVGPSVHNAAITDAQAYLQGKLTDVGVDLYQPEFRYWER